MERAPPLTDSRPAAQDPAFAADDSLMPPASLAQLVSRRPQRFVHAHPPVRNVNALVGHLTWGQRIADGVAATMGSWRFIIIQSLLLAIWIVLNVAAWLAHWDPYPFILLNLVLSFQAAYAAPIIMMSQNRQAEKDRIAAQHDYDVNVKAEEEVKAILDHLEYQHELTLHMLARLEHRDAQLLATLGEQVAGASVAAGAGATHAAPPQ